MRKAPEVRGSSASQPKKYGVMNRLEKLLLALDPGPGEVVGRLDREGLGQLRAANQVLTVPKGTDRLGRSGPGYQVGGVLLQERGNQGPVRCCWVVVAMASAFRFSHRLMRSPSSPRAQLTPPSKRATRRSGNGP